MTFLPLKNVSATIGFSKLSKCGRLFAASYTQIVAGNVLMSFSVSPANGALNGILKTLWNKRSSYYQTVKVICSDNYNSDHYYNKASNVLNWDTSEDQRYWSELTSIEHWVGYEFLKGYVSLTHYSIRTTTDNSGNYTAPKEWNVYGSLDNQHWIHLDYRNTDETKNPPETFTYPTKKAGLIKYIKFVQIDDFYTYIYKDSLALNKFELFGKFSLKLNFESLKKASISSLFAKFINSLLIST